MPGQLHEMSLAVAIPTVENAQFGIAVSHIFQVTGKRLKPTVPASSEQFNSLVWRRSGFQPLHDAPCDRWP
jgi:hypothetical protein